jgi:hypothetical protein
MQPVSGNCLPVTILENLAIHMIQWRKGIIVVVDPK